MNIQLSKEQLLNGLLSAEKIASKNVTLPVLHCILLIAKEKTLTLRATNLEVGIEIMLPAKVEHEGRVAVPASVLTSVVAASDTGVSITLSTTESVLTVESAGSSTNIKTLDSEEFPTIPVLSEGKGFTVMAELLVRGLRSVGMSVSNSTIKPELASVFVHPKGNTITFAATDSFRLAEKIVSAKQPVESEPLLLPARTIPDILRVLEAAKDEEVQVHCNEHQISFSYNGTYFTSRLTEGVFPDYHQIVPKEWTAEVTVLKQDMLSALKKATIFSDRFHQVTFIIDPKKKLFTLHAENADVGETTDSVAAALTGDAITVSFNQRYIIDCFQSIASDSVTFSIGGLSKPMVIKGVSDQSFFYLVMPMNK